MHAVCALAPLVAACSSSVVASSGAGEPLRISNGQFFRGAFPSASGGPEVSVLSANNTIRAGMTGKNLHGLTGSDAVSVAVAFQGLGQGYWIVPVGIQDSNTPGFTWSALADISRDVPGGDQTLLFAASNQPGAFGPTNLQKVQVIPFLPPGHAVASLTWGNDADLDLHIVSPDGKELDPKHINTTGVVDGGPDAGSPLPGDGQLDRDSNPDCATDGLRTENVIWLDEVPAGTYLFRVDMFSACGVASTNFKFTLYVDGSSVFEQSGRLLNINADGGGPGSGLFVGSYTF